MKLHQPRAEREGCRRHPTANQILAGRLCCVCYFLIFVFPVFVHAGWDGGGGFVNVFRGFYLENVFRSSPPGVSFGFFVRTAEAPAIARAQRAPKGCLAPPTVKVDAWKVCGPYVLAPTLERGSTVRHSYSPGRTALAGV